MEHNQIKMKELAYKNNFFEAVQEEMANFRGQKKAMYMAYEKTEEEFERRNGRRKYADYEVFASAFSRYIRESVINRAENAHNRG